MNLILKEIRKIFLNRHLIWKLSVNQIKVKYRYPILGLFWLILMPIFLSVIFLFAFSVVIKVKIPEYPFFIYLLSAMLPWNYFSSSVNQTTNSLIDNVNLVKNVAFCREIIPISSILANLFNFLFTLPVFFIFILIFHIKVPVYIFFLPFVIILHSILIAGIGFFCSAFQVHLRDTKYIVEIFVTAIFYLVPVVYPLDFVRTISPKFLIMYLLNPLVSITNLYRITLLGNYVKCLPPEVNMFNLIIFPSLVSIILFYSGFMVFKRLESNFADLI